MNRVQTTVRRLAPFSGDATSHPASTREIALVLGCDEIASAIAHRLHCDGFGVVLIERVDPSAPRRGMSFTDAWFYGTAELSGLHAVFCASLRSIPSVLRGDVSIAATTWSWSGVAAALDPIVTVDTREPSQRTVLDRTRGRAMRMIEIHAGAVSGPEFDVAVPPTLRADHSRRATVRAAAPGRFASLRNIGERVQLGEAIGALGATLVRSPATGTLRGVSARGARVFANDLIAEVDRDAERYACFGLDADATLVAAAVSTVVSEGSG